MNTRRGFLRTMLGGAWTGAALLEQSVLRAAAARAQARPDLPALFDIEKVAGGIWAAIAHPAPFTNCNAAIFENERDLLIVDAHSKPSAVVSLVAQIRRDLTSKPVKYIVNSHFHWDHVQGMPAYRRIAPYADVVASEVTRKLISENSAKNLEATLAQAGKSLETYKQRLAAAKTDAEKNYFREMQAGTRDFLSEMAGYKPELPNITFERDLILHDKAHDLHLAFRGKGHTAGDIVVWCPQKKVIAAGDLVHGFAPYIGDGFPRLWPRTLRQMAEFEFDHIIGGHAAVQRGKDRLDQMAGYIEELSEVVARGKKTGRTAAELAGEIKPASLASLTRGGYGEFLAASLGKYQLQAPGTPPDQILANAVRGNVLSVYATLERE